MCSSVPEGGGLDHHAKAGVSRHPQAYGTAPTRRGRRCWVSGLLRSILRTRTDFAAFLLSTLHLPRLSKPAPPSGSVFPIPLPFPGLFQSFPLQSGSRFRKRIMHRRLLHIVCMALNFLHSNYVPIPLSALQRPANAAQRRLVAHVGRHLKAFGASVGEFVLADSGRRNPQLLARLSELTSFLSAQAVSGDAYADLSGTVIPTHNDAHPGLDPFRSLTVPRLRLSGKGHWDPGPFLQDELYMAYLEPRSLLHGLPPPDSFLPVWTREDPAQVAALAELWDEMGLLRLAPSRLRSSDAYLLSRAFNCYKAPDRDRMIIDRRGQNFAECRLAGPSLFIPVAPMLCMLEANPKRQTVCCAATDRKDFYHQIRAHSSRAVANALGPALPRSAVCHLGAFSSLLPPCPFGRWARADCFSEEPPGDELDPLLFDADHYLVCFGAIAQGDQLGVEIGTAAHGLLLESGGLLDQSSRLCANRPFKGCDEAQGLVIDDYFSVSVHDVHSPAAPACLGHLAAAKALYASEGLAGSDDKDILGLTCAKIAGGELNSSASARAQDLITIAAPASKRIALSIVSLEAARFQHITDVLMLSVVGSWTSAALFRRPLMSVLSDVFGVASAGTVCASKPKLCRLSRSAAQELVVMSVLSPLAASEISAPLSPMIFATDASEHKGGYVVTEVGADVSRPLWRTASKKGGYSRLWSKEESILARFHDRETFDLRLLRDDFAPAPSRPLAYYFDFVEIGCSAGQVSGLLAHRGFRVGPRISVKESAAYDVMQLRTFEWLLHLLQQRKLKGFLCWPPVATFRVGSWPSWRTVAAPKGRWPAQPRTQAANALALRFLSLLFVAVECGAFGALIHPAYSPFRWFPEWKRLLNFGAREFEVCSCFAEGVCCKGFVLLAFGIDFQSLVGPCAASRTASQRGGSSGAIPHLLSSSFSDSLCHEFASALRRVSHVTSSTSLSVEGLESYVLNDIVTSHVWRDGDAWYWRATAHINILESASVLRLLKRLASHGPLRIVVLVDSSVALHACAKGRSPSRGLMPILRKIAALCLGAGLFPAYHFVPTRLNPGDCPTRDLPLPSPLDCSFWTSLSRDQLYEGLSQPKLKRWASNWARLACLVLQVPPSFSPDLGWRTFSRSSRIFDSTLGFPGEGPFFRVFFCWFWVSAVAAPSHGLRPRNPADEKRSRARAATVLCEGRPVEPVTQRRRDKLLEAFKDWLWAQEVVLSDLFDLQPQTTRRLNNFLVRYGRELFEAGWPYSHYSEVINAISGKEPALRRSLQPAWDLAFAWLREEPHSHHVALPWQLLIALITTAMMWGWPRVAGMLALTWGALMRVGETLAARRDDLLLPSDVGDTMSYGLVSIHEPKTRFRAARHQSARIDQPDLLSVVKLAFEHLPGPSKLWPYSASTLRSRFGTLVRRLGADKWAGQGSKSLDLGSLRAGGATWLLQSSEDSELVRRRGRWLNSRTMEIYIQEISSLQFLNKLSVPSRQLILSLLDSFAEVLQVALQLQLLHTPTTCWYARFSVG
ncbi:unnamed protein product [Symbiodinium sp. CCMP2592]|nr:unnamed protein product [Symbiodinium sp. CCMP2592]